MIKDSDISEIMFQAQNFARKLDKNQLREMYATAYIVTKQHRSVANEMFAFELKNIGVGVWGTLFGDSISKEKIKSADDWSNTALSYAGWLYFNSNKWGKLNIVKCVTMKLIKAGLKGFIKDVTSEHVLREYGRLVAYLSAVDDGFEDERKFAMVKMTEWNFNGKFNDELIALGAKGIKGSGSYISWLGYLRD